MALAGWNPNNILRLTIDSSKIDDALTNFPVLVTLSSGTGITGFDAAAVFDELTTVTGTHKIAITDSSDNQLYVEIENWDWVNELANLWVKVPTIVSTTDTNLYLYYDSTHEDNTHYVGGVADLNYSMVVNIGTEGTYDTSHVRDSCVIKESDSSYKMWYSGYDAGYRYVMYAESNNGTTWSGNQMVVDIGSEGTYDVNFADAPCVIKDGSTYKMWYSGYIPSNYRIIYATSADGINWSNFQMVVNIGSEGTYDTNYAYYPCVIKDDSTYKMWYTGYDGTYWRIIYATSTNGTTWSNFQMVNDKGSEGTYDTSRALSSNVIKDGNLYKMWYAGWDGSNYRLIHAVSTDGINWTDHQMVLNIGSEGVYDTTHVSMPFVVKESDYSYKMWYSGYDSSNVWRILYSSYWDVGVWNKNFVGVWHMAQDPSIGGACILDSTSYINHGTPAGTMLTEDLVDGKAGKALDFDGGDDNINIGTPTNLNFGTGYFTLDFVIKPDSIGSNQRIIDKQSNTAPYVGIYYAQINAAGTVKFFVRDVSYSTGGVESISTLVSGTYYQVSCVYDSTGSKVYIDNALNNSNLTTVGDIDNRNQDFVIGEYFYDGIWQFGGIIDEVRVSNTDRPAEWLKATYYSNWNILITFSEATVFGKTIINGEWKNISSVQLTIDGEWKDVSEIQIIKNGTWKPLIS